MPSISLTGPMRNGVQLFGGSYRFPIPIIRLQSKPTLDFHTKLKNLPTSSTMNITKHMFLYSVFISSNGKKPNIFGAFISSIWNQNFLLFLFPLLVLSNSLFHLPMSFLVLWYTSRISFHFSPLLWY